ncbi:MULTISPECIES: DUF2306 domain-containing protein [Hydrocarboniphaga]|uniref:DUF2306 domain-containing protein n=1 Tax=Hydrocarboniphaga effusa AP103 TaxID=1172194 RepID=I8TCQ0_9GAMM|nr:MULTISPECIES: DUF2306 domain-containing protein [Hydrocarboniphaga]EIT71740.1 hypothetical protein WQQ_18770 [Hydrocarboniphaga effusa AP103]MDZ4080363.1 DUF2306 domain-containing protein [Hydrocarboniphaga sp.]
MTYSELSLIHLTTVVPAFALGSWLMLRPKGTPPHRALGKAYLLLMFATGWLTLLMPALLGPKLMNHFGLIHLFSLLAIVAPPRALFAARRGDIATHRRAMIGLYVGGLLIAGFFAFAVPGRLLHRLLFGN